MPLWKYLDDAVAVAGRLWNSWVPRSVLGGMDAVEGDDARARRLLTWLARIEDVVKASPAFAVQSPEGARRMAAHGLTTAQWGTAARRSDLAAPMKDFPWVAGAVYPQPSVYPRVLLCLGDPLRTPDTSSGGARLLAVTFYGHEDGRVSMGTEIDSTKLGLDERGVATVGVTLLDAGFVDGIEVDSLGVITSCPAAAPP
jgi:hypothetical protein